MYGCSIEIECVCQPGIVAMLGTLPRHREPESQITDRNGQEQFENLDFEDPYCKLVAKSGCVVSRLNRALLKWTHGGVRDGSIKHMLQR